MRQRIDVHDTIIFLVGDVLHRPRLWPDARIVDEDVDATKPTQGLFAQTPLGIFVWLR